MRFTLALLLIPGALLLVGCGALGINVHYGNEHPCADTSSPPARAATASDLHVVTWNLHGTPEHGPRDARFARIADEVLRRAPDLVAFQEVWFQVDAKLLAERLSETYAQISPSEKGWGTFLFGHRPGGLLSFVRKSSAWSVAQPAALHEFTEHAPAWRLFNEGDGAAGKGFERYTLQRDEQRLTIVVTHMQSPYPGRPYTEIRAAQFEELDAGATEPGNRNPVLLLGDLNTPPGELSGFSKGRWADLTQWLQDQCHCASNLDPVVAPDGTESSVPGNWIDYVLLKRPTGTASLAVADARLIRSTGVDCPFSDHQGVEMFLRVKP